MRKNQGATGMSPLYLTLPFLLFLIAGSISVTADTSQADPDASTAKSDTESQGTLPLIRNYLSDTETESPDPMQSGTTQK